tara:strand:- start:2500 stop:2613 length:114 start_codon:yes stop_codon:yes gene_type:complete
MTAGSIVVVMFMLLCIGFVGCLKLYVDLSQPSSVRPI